MRGKDTDTIERGRHGVLVSGVRMFEEAVCFLVSIVRDWFASLEKRHAHH